MAEGGSGRRERKEEAEEETRRIGAEDARKGREEKGR